MKKSFFFRLMVLGFIAFGSFVLAGTRSLTENTEQQLIEELPTSTSSKHTGEFLILESITRYLTASHQ